MLKDLVVVLPGIAGSVLSKDGKEVWGGHRRRSGGWSPAYDSIHDLSIKGVDDPHWTILATG